MRDIAAEQVLAATRIALGRRRSSPSVTREPLVHRLTCVERRHDLARPRRRGLAADHGDRARTHAARSDPARCRRRCRPAARRAPPRDAAARYRPRSRTRRRRSAGRRRRAARARARAHCGTRRAMRTLRSRSARVPQGSSSSSAAAGQHPPGLDPGSLRPFLAGWARGMQQDAVGPPAGRRARRGRGRNRGRRPACTQAPAPVSSGCARSRAGGARPGAARRRSGPPAARACLRVVAMTAAAREPARSARCAPALAYR